MIADTTEQPFSGLKVLDLSWVGVGPIVARHLADFGATVIRVETSTRPDTLRLAPPFRDGVPGLDRSAFGAQFNSNKFGLSLNLRLPEARALATRLAAWADLVTDSMTPGSLDHLGLGYAALRAVNPRLIMYSTTQQGQTGPYRSFGGYGSHGAATAGFYALAGWPDRPPAGLFGAYTDFLAPWSLIAAVAAALDHRDRTGEGQYIEQSQVEAGLHMLGPELLAFGAGDSTVTRRGNDDAELVPNDVYPCAGEDRWVAISVRDAADWAALARLIGQTEWADDPAFATVAGRREQRDAIDTAIGEWTRVHTPREAMAAAQAVGVPAGAVQTPGDLFSDPQIAARGHWWDLEHAVMGSHAYDAPAWTLSETPAVPRRAGPALGQHTGDVCREILGLDEDEIARLTIAGVFE